MPDTAGSPLQAAGDASPRPPSASICSLEPKQSPALQAIPVVINAEACSPMLQVSTPSTPGELRSISMELTNEKEAASRQLAVLRSSMEGLQQRFEQQEAVLSAKEQELATWRRRGEDLMAGQRELADRLFTCEQELADTSAERDELEALLEKARSSGAQRAAASSTSGSGLAAAAAATVAVCGAEAAAGSKEEEGGADLGELRRRLEAALGEAHTLRARTEALERANEELRDGRGGGGLPASSSEQRADAAAGSWPGKAAAAGGDSADGSSLAEEEAHHARKQQLEGLLLRASQAEEELASSRKDAERYEAQAAQLRLDVVEMQQRLEEQEAAWQEGGDPQAALAEQEQRFKLLQRQMSEADAERCCEIDELHEQLLDVRAKVSKLESQLKDEQHKQLQSLAIKGKMEQELQRTQEELMDKDKALESCEAELQAMRGDLEVSRLDVQRLRAELDHERSCAAAAATAAAAAAAADTATGGAQDGGVSGEEAGKLQAENEAMAGELIEKKLVLAQMHEQLMGLQRELALLVRDPPVARQAAAGRAR